MWIQNLHRVEKLMITLLNRLYFNHFTDQNATTKIQLVWMDCSKMKINIWKDTRYIKSKWIGRKEIFTNPFVLTGGQINIPARLYYA
jgi:hypothetical protein